MIKRKQRCLKRMLMLLSAIVVGTASMLAQQATVMRGTVLSAEDHEPIIGATVRVDGTQVGTATDAQGQFTLTGVPAKAKHVTVSYIGYATKRADLAPVMKVVLEPTSEMLDEVVAVAFGKQKRESFTGSAAVLKAEDIQRQQVNSPIEALNGRISGLQMNETNSLTQDPEITIRGIGSLNASTSPLIVVDGLPYNGYWNDLNPADIASMTVLKDAASNALYGSRGANGVVLITTKSAQRGTTNVTFDAKWGANTNGYRDYDRVDNPAEYYEMHYAALRNYYQNAKGLSAGAANLAANADMGKDSKNGGLGYLVYSVPENQNLIGLNGKLNPAATLGNRVMYKGNVYTLLPDNWRDEGLRTGFRQEYNVSLSGGNDRYTLMASIGYLSNEGICYGTDLERTSARIKTDYKAFSFLKVGANAGYTHTSSNVQGNAFSSAYNMAPIYPLYVRDGNGNIMRDEHGPMYDYGAGEGAAPGIERPADPNANNIQADRLDVSKNVANAFNIQGWADVEFLKDFKLTVNASVYITENRIGYGYNPFYGYQSTATHGTVGTYHYRTTDTNFQQLLNYHKQWGQNTIDALIGHEYSHNSQTELGALKNNVADFLHNTELDGAIVNGSIYGNQSDYNVEGYFARATYDWGSRYFASGSFRRDGSTIFHPKHRWGNFWSLGAAWIASREEWFPKNPTLNMLKLKLSYGEQGNDGIGSFRYTDYYTLVNFNDEPAYILSRKGNENITWEKVGCLNAGIEFEMWNSRLRGGIEYYTRKTSDMLMFFAAPSSIGYSGYYDNVGDMRNSGLELDLSADIIATRDFSWNVNLNLTWQRNRVTRLAEDNKDLTIEGHRGYQNVSCFVGEGLPVNTWYIKRYAGVGPQGQPLYYHTAEDGTLEAGSYDNGDYFLCGDALPKVFGGFGTQLNFRGFDLSAQFNYSLGGKRMDSKYLGLMTPPKSGFTGAQFHRDLYNAWTPENTSSDIPRWQYGDQETGMESDRWLTSADYLSFKNLTLGYTLPQSLTRKFACQRLRVFFTCDNVYYWTARRGFDPRTFSAADYTSDSSSFIPMRTFSGGLNIQF